MNIRLFYRRSFTASCTDVIGRYTVAVAPNSTGTATQISCEIVNTQEPFLSPSQVTFPGTTTGVPQHLVKVAPVFAKGFMVTGTQMEAD